MRIITGSKKGMNLYTLEGDTVTRPTSQRVKEAVFSMLQYDIEDRTVLDLFGGCGQLALECISRGAKSAVICEKDKDAIKVIRKNIEKTGFSDSASLVSGDAVSYLSGYSGDGFDLIFIDPPYASDLLMKVKPFLKNVVKPTTIIIVESGSPVKEFYSDEFDTVKEAKYSVSYVTVLRPKQKKEKSCMVPGSFDPITYGHLDIIRRAFERYEKVYVAVLNNPDKNYTFTREERTKLAETAVKEFGSRVEVLSSDGMNVDLCKEYGVFDLVKGVRNPTDLAYEKKIAEINAGLLPGLRTHFMEAADRWKEVSSTLVRGLLRDGRDVSAYLPEPVARLADDFLNSKQNSQ